MLITIGGGGRVEGVEEVTAYILGLTNWDPLQLSLCAGHLLVVLCARTGGPCLFAVEPAGGHIQDFNFKTWLGLRMLEQELKQECSQGVLSTQQVVMARRHRRLTLAENDGHWKD